MPPKTQLPPGYISIEEAVEIIKSDTRQNPVVDMDYLIEKMKWIEVSRGFRIPKIRRLPKEEITMSPYGKPIEYEKTGSINVMVNTSFEKELLRKTISDKYRELMGREYQERNTRAISTVADDAQGKDAVKPRANKPIAQEGQAIGDGQTITTNGQNLTV